MFEVLARCAMARLGVFHTRGRTVSTPNIVFTSTPIKSAPPEAEIVLGPRSEAKLNLPYGGTVFYPEGDGAALPFYLPYPRSMDEVRGHRSVERGNISLLRSESSIPKESEAELVVVQNAIQYLNDARGFADRIEALRVGVGYNRLLYFPGLAVPSNLALLVYCGIDFIDDLRVIYDSDRKVFHTSDGSLDDEQIQERICDCVACAEQGSDWLERHNLRALALELSRVRQHIRSGDLRVLVEKRVVNDPWATEVLRHVDLRHFEFQEVHFPVSGGRLLAYSHQSLTRPDVVRFRRRIGERYSKPPSARALVLLPCSARKPYSLSKSHRLFRKAIRASGCASLVHEVIVTSPLGLVPRELERFYPASSYDIPVTGDWSQDEVLLLRSDVENYLKTNRYDLVVAHIDRESQFLRDVLNGAVFTGTEGVTSRKGLEMLATTLRDSLSGLPRPAWSARMLEEIANIARFQFGDAGLSLTKDISVKGRFPSMRLFSGEKQLAAHTERGALSLTLHGGEVLSKLEVHCVEIEDFEPRGNIFAVGVESTTNDFRIGDEVVVRHGKDVRAVGTALMNPREMVDLKRGEAVHVRHRSTQKNI